MKKTRLVLIAVMTSFMVLSASNAMANEAKAKGTSIGVLAGLGWPMKSGPDYTVSEAYGFFVDLPLTATFYISPETLFYRLNRPNSQDGDYGLGVTDLSLNFKFVVPLGTTKISFGMRGGASNGVHAENGWPMTVHFGALAGFDYNFISNVSISSQIIWEFMPSQGGNIYQLFALAGIRFTI